MGLLYCDSDRILLTLGDHFNRSALLLCIIAHSQWLLEKKENENENETDKAREKEWHSEKNINPDSLVRLAFNDFQVNFSFYFIRL